MKKRTRILSLILSAVMLAGIIPAMTFTSTAAFVGASGTKYDNSIRFDENGEFRLMQISDIQDDTEVDETTLQVISQAIDKYHPDLIVLTGDNVTTKMNESEFKQSVNQWLSIFTEKGVRYAATFGNHDSEGTTLNPAWARSSQYNYYANYSSMAVDYQVASLVDSTHVGTGTIPIYSHDGSLVKYAIMPFDSGDYDSNGNYDGVNAATISYYNTMVNELKTYNNGNNVPTMVFQHIPMQELYDTGLQVASSGTPGAVAGTAKWSSNYYIINPALYSTGKMNEGPCPNYIDNNQYETILASGVCAGVFYGHDHTNTFVLRDTNGLIQGYDKAATLHSYNDGDPGLRVFTIYEQPKADAEFDYYDTQTVTNSSLNGTEDEHDLGRDDVSGTPSVPTTIYVGKGDNGVNQQEFGNVIQTSLLNHQTQKMYSIASSLELSFEVDKNATAPVLTAPSTLTVVSNGSVVGTDTTTYKWKITGGTAQADTQLEFKFTYVKNGVTFTQYGYSYVEDIKSPAGHYFYTRCYGGSSSSSEKNWSTIYAVTTVLGENAYGHARATTDDTLLNSYDDKEVGNWTNAPAGYYKYGGNGEDDDFVNKGLPYGLNFCSPSRTRIQGNGFPRFYNGGKAPQTDIYIDTAEVSNLSQTDLSIHFYRTHSNTRSENSDQTTVFKTGDASYNQDTFGTGNTSALGVTNNGGSLSYLAKSNFDQHLTGSIPANGSKYTAISRLHCIATGGDYNRDNNTYAPFYLVFNVYNKGDLHDLLTDERAEARQAGNYSEVAWARYFAAYKEAWKQDQKVRTNQTSIDAAYNALSVAVSRLDEPEGAPVPTNPGKSGNVSVPSRVYIAGSDYGLSQQPDGNKMVTSLVNYKTGTLDPNYTTFSITPPSGATGVTCSVSCSNSSATINTPAWDSASYSGTLSGGTGLDEGDIIYYTFSYLLNGKTFIVRDASIVAKAPRASGWAAYVAKEYWSWFTTYRTTQQYTAYIATAGAPADGFAFDVLPTTTRKDNYNVGVNFTSYDGLSSQHVAGWGIGDWDPDHAKEDHWFAGAKNDETSTSDTGMRARFTITLDSSKISSTNQLNLFFKIISLNTEGNRGILRDQADYRWLCSGARTVTTDNTPGNISASQMAWGSYVMGGSYGYAAGEIRDAGQTFYCNFTGSERIGEGTYTAATKYYCDGKNNDDKGTNMRSYNMWEFYVNYTPDLSSLRNLVNSEVNLCRQQSDGYTAASFAPYTSALLAAQAVLANPKATVVEADNAQTNLENAIAGFDFERADYSALNAKIAEIFEVEYVGGSIKTDSTGKVVLAHNGTTDTSARCYRPYPDNDPVYYNRGEFYIADNFVSTNEVDIPYDNIKWNYNILYQETVNSYIQSLSVGWENMRLNNADFTACDNFMNSYKEGVGENNAAGGAYIVYQGVKMPASYFVTSTYQAWSDACHQAETKRTYKMPDQAIVDGFYDDLVTAYNNLELAPADYSEVTAIVDEINANVSLTTPVVDPADASNNYDLPYYDEMYVFDLCEYIAQYDTTFKKDEQSRVDAIAADFMQKFTEMTDHLSAADTQFLAAQINQTATYESNPTKYYTDDTWAAYNGAKNTYRPWLTAELFSSEQADVNAAAKAIYDARNALTYKGADYSEVDEWIAAANLLTSTNYTTASWTALQNAINAVDRTLDITQQATVDGYADAIEAAYNALVLLSADYTALNNAITAADAILASEDNYKNYTDGTVQTLRTELAAAKTVKNHTPVYTILEQATVTNAANALQAAIDGLKYKPADLTPAEQAMDLYNSIYVDGYVDEYGENVLNAVNSAAEPVQALIDNAANLDIRDNANIIAKAQALTEEYYKLPALYGDLTLAKGDIPDDLEPYTDESVANLQNFLNSINYNLKIADQATVDEYVGTLYELIDALELKPQDVILIAAPGTDVIINDDLGFIYGLTIDDVYGAVDGNDLLNDGYVTFAEDSAEGYLVYNYSNDENIIGTGTTVEVRRTSDDELMKTYTIVVFGDFDGNGYIESADLNDFVYYNAFLDEFRTSTFDYDSQALVEDCHAFALDIDGDGEIDADDTMNILYYAAFFDGVTVSQTHGEK